MSVQILLQKDISKARCEAQYVLCAYCERAGNSNLTSACIPRIQLMQHGTCIAVCSRSGPCDNSTDILT